MQDWGLELPGKDLGMFDNRSQALSRGKIEIIITRKNRYV